MSGSVLMPDYYLQAHLSKKNLSRARLFYQALIGEDLECFDRGLRKAIERNMRRHGKFLFIARNLPWQVYTRGLRLLATLEGDDLKLLTDLLIEAIRLGGDKPRELLDQFEQRQKACEVAANPVLEVTLAS